jgi:PAS domain S-box-containing protein
MTDRVFMQNNVEYDQADCQDEAVRKALHDAELRYRIVADFTYDWEYWQGPDGNLRYVSPSCERITGYPPERFVNDPQLLDQLILPDDAPIWARHRHAPDLAGPRGIQFRIRRRDGQIRWVEHVCQPVTDERGEFLGTRASNRDITDRKHAEAELLQHREHLEELVARRTSELAEANATVRASQQFYQSTLDALSDNIAVLDQDGTIVAVNASWRRFAQDNGLEWADYGVGRNYLSVLESAVDDGMEGAQDALAGIQELMAGQREQFQMEYPCHSFDNKRWFVMRVTRFQRNGGVRVVTAHEDVTERVLADEMQSRLAAIVESSDDAIIGKSLAGTILSWNAGAERIYDYSAQDAIGQPVSILLPDDRPDEVAQLLERLARGESVAHFETRRIRQDGRQITVSLNISPIKDSTGRIVGASTIARDITARKQAEQALHEAKEAAEKARREEEQRRYEAVRRRQIAESLGDVLTILNSNRGLDEVLDYITVQAGQLLGTRAAAVYSLESETGTLAIRAGQGLLLTYMGGVEIPIGQGALLEAMASHKPVPVSSLAAALTSEEALVRGAGEPAAVKAWVRIYRSLLAVPILVQGQVYGGMLLYYAESREFSDEELELAVTFADQVALAIANARLREQVQQTATTAERDRLARELHDAVTQTLFSASLIAEAMPRVWERDPDQGRRGLEELRQLTQGAAAEMRTMLVELRPAALTEKPLGELLRHLTHAMSSRTRVPISLSVDGNCSLPAEVQIALYRIAQEALNNVAKHAGATQAAVELSGQPTWAKLRVTDNGSGFDLLTVLPDRFGLSIMRERATSIGARMEMHSRQGEGTQIRVHWQATGGREKDG